MCDIPISVTNKSFNLFSLCLIFLLSGLYFRLNLFSLSAGAAAFSSENGTRTRHDTNDFPSAWNIPSVWLRWLWFQKSIRSCSEKKLDTRKILIELFTGWPVKTVVEMYTEFKCVFWWESYYIFVFCLHDPWEYFAGQLAWLGSSVLGFSSERWGFSLKRHLGSSCTSFCCPPFCHLVCSHFSSVELQRKRQIWSLAPPNLQPHLFHTMGYLALSRTHRHTHIHKILLSVILCRSLWSMVCLLFILPTNFGTKPYCHSYRGTECKSELVRNQKCNCLYPLKRTEHGERIAVKMTTKRTSIDLWLGPCTFSHEDMALGAWSKGMGLLCKCVVCFPMDSVQAACFKALPSTMLVSKYTTIFWTVMQFWSRRLCSEWQFDTCRLAAIYAIYL